MISTGCLWDIYWLCLNLSACREANIKTLLQVGEHSRSSQLKQSKSIKHFDEKTTNTHATVAPLSNKKLANVLQQSEIKSLFLVVFLRNMFLNKD